MILITLSSDELHAKMREYEEKLDGALYFMNDGSCRKVSREYNERKRQSENASMQMNAINRELMKRGSK